MQEGVLLHPSESALERGTWCHELVVDRLQIISDLATQLAAAFALSDEGESLNGAAGVQTKVDHEVSAFDPGVYFFDFSFVVVEVVAVGRECPGFLRPVELRGGVLLHLRDLVGTNRAEIVDLGVALVSGRVEEVGHGQDVGRSEDHVHEGGEREVHGTLDGVLAGEGAVVAVGAQVAVRVFELTLLLQTRRGADVEVSGHTGGRNRVDRGFEGGGRWQFAVSTAPVVTHAATGSVLRIRATTIFSTTPQQQGQGEEEQRKLVHLVTSLFGRVGRVEAKASMSIKPRKRVFVKQKMRYH